MPRALSKADLYQSSALDPPEGPAAAAALGAGLDGPAAETAEVDEFIDEFTDGVEDAVPAAAAAGAAIACAEGKGGGGGGGGAVTAAATALALALSLIFFCHCWKKLPSLAKLLTPELPEVEGAGEGMALVGGAVAGGG